MSTLRAGDEERGYLPGDDFAAYRCGGLVFGCRLDAAPVAVGLFALITSWFVGRHAEGTRDVDARGWR